MIFPDRKLLRGTCVVRRCMGDLILCALCEWYAMFGIKYTVGLTLSRQAISKKIRLASEMRG